MALDGKKMGREIAAAIIDSGASSEAIQAVNAVWEKIGDAICSHIVKNIEVTIPVSQVVVNVTGQAAGVKNPAAISCNVDK